MLRQLYAQYSENYAQAMETYEKAKKNKEFALFLEVCSLFHYAIVQLDYAHHRYSEFRSKKAKLRPSFKRRTF